jgi:hypothetical protein
MAKVVTMHQPNYLPWIGLFSKVSLADCLILYDNAQYEHEGVVNRNKIRTNTGFNYLTIPVRKIYRFDKISNVSLPGDGKWREVHWRTIYQNYVKTPFFRDHRDFFGELYQEDFQYLWQLNEKILLYLLECFQIKVEVLKTSELIVKPGLCKTDLMIAYLKAAGAGVYLSGPSGKNYLECEKFPQNNIILKYFKFQHPVYRQRYPGFEPNLSAIDLLFNLGPEAAKLIKTSGSIED